MKTPLQEIEAKLRWAGGAWFIWSIGITVGDWLGIPGVKIDKTTGLLWFGSSGLLMLAFFIGECTKAILAAVSAIAVFASWDEVSLLWSRMGADYDVSGGWYQQPVYRCN